MQMQMLKRRSKSIKISLSFLPPTYKTFCKSLNLWEMKKNENNRPEQLVRKTICMMILASLGSHKRRVNAWLDSYRSLRMRSDL